MTDTPGSPETTGTPAGEAGLGARFALLWEQPEETRRGRPARVSRAQVVDAAVRIADEAGLDAVSMRSVATALAVAPMTLYTHVPGRTELVDAMIDRAYADWELPSPELAWRPALERFGRGYWQVLRRHPWLLEVNPWRLPLAPHVLAAQEAGYRCLVDTGLTPDQVVDTIDVVSNSIAGLARAAAVEAAEESSQGLDYAAFWAGTTEFWERHFDPSRFPTMTRLWVSGAFDAGATPFELRLGGLLDTIGLLVEHADSDPATVIPSFEECMSRMTEGGR